MRRGQGLSPETVNRKGRIDHPAALRAERVDEFCLEELADSPLALK